MHRRSRSSTRECAILGRSFRLFSSSGRSQSSTLTSCMFKRRTIPGSTWHFGPSLCHFRSCRQCTTSCDTRVTAVPHASVTVQRAHGAIGSIGSSCTRRVSDFSSRSGGVSRTSAGPLFPMASWAAATETPRRVGPDPVERSTNTVLFFGRVWPYKGLDVLVEALTMFGADRSTRLVVAGSGEPIAPYVARLPPPHRGRGA